MNKSGTLYIVATPIGNLEDITLRALRILQEVDIIAAEDTRQTIKLLNHFEIKNNLVSYYEHNKIEKGKYLIEQLLSGKDIALVSDAGSPGISDPGEDIIKLALEHDVRLTMVPGATAAVMGLVLSGLPTGRFAFEGFLPVNKKLRNERLKSIKNDTRTLILYEAPHKLVRTLKDLRDAFGNRQIVLARELTKRFEEVCRITVDEAIEKYNVESPRGEFVLILEGADDKQMKEESINSWTNISLREHVSKYICDGLSKKEAMKKTAEDRGLSKRDVYNGLLEE
mgnify:CR=1 FL=1